MESKTKDTDYDQFALDDIDRLQNLHSEQNTANNNEETAVPIVLEPYFLSKYKLLNIAEGEFKKEFDSLFYPGSFKKTEYYHLLMKFCKEKEINIEKDKYIQRLFLEHAAKTDIVIKELDKFLHSNAYKDFYFKEVFYLYPYFSNIKYFLSRTISKYNNNKYSGDEVEWAGKFFKKFGNLVALFSIVDSGLLFIKPFRDAELALNKCRDLYNNCDFYIILKHYVDVTSPDEHLTGWKKFKNILPKDVQQDCKTTMGKIVCYLLENPNHPKWDKDKNLKNLKNYILGNDAKCKYPIEEDNGQMDAIKLGIAEFYKKRLDIQNGYSVTLFNIALRLLQNASASNWSEDKNLDDFRTFILKHALNPLDDKDSTIINNAKTDISNFYKNRIEEIILKNYYILWVAKKLKDHYHTYIVKQVFEMFHPVVRVGEKAEYFEDIQKLEPSLQNIGDNNKDNICGHKPEKGQLQNKELFYNNLDGARVFSTNGLFNNPKEAQLSTSLFNSSAGLKKDIQDLFPKLNDMALQLQEITKLKLQEWEGMRQLDKDIVLTKEAEIKESYKSFVKEYELKTFTLAELKKIGTEILGTRK